MITSYPLSSEAEVIALPEPKHVTLGLTEIIVRTGEHNPNPSLAQLKSELISQTYLDVDAVYADKIGNREKEYLHAETGAREFKAAGYSGACSEFVSHWAAVKGITNQQAADAIIAQADALNAAMLSLRNGRFDAQAEIGASQTASELSVAWAAWVTFIANTRTALGL